MSDSETAAEQTQQHQEEEEEQQQQQQQEHDDDATQAVTEEEHEEQSEQKNITLEQQLDVGVIPQASDWTGDIKSIASTPESTLKSPPTHNIPQATGREWTVEYTNPEKITVSSIQFSIRTRTDAPTFTLPSKLYSSLKYKFKQTMWCTIHGDSNSNNMLISKMQVFNALTHSEVIKQKKPILSGNHNDNAGTLQATNNSRGSALKELVCETAFRFNDVSYHHSKADFLLKLSFYLPSDLQNPVHVVHSAPFQVYARRSASQKKQNAAKSGMEDDEEEEQKPTPARKRRRSSAAPTPSPDVDEEEEEGEAESPEPVRSAKKRKHSSEPTLTNYLSLLDELIHHKSKLTDAEQKSAVDAVVKKLNLTVVMPQYMIPQAAFNTLNAPNVNLTGLQPPIPMPFYLPPFGGIPQNMINMGNPLAAVTPVNPQNRLPMKK